ncbi:MAG: Small molecule diffusion facilitator (permease), partial [uncultured Rubrobacteraceae bacterium]
AGGRAGAGPPGGAPVVAQGPLPGAHLGARGRDRARRGVHGVELHRREGRDVRFAHSRVGGRAAVHLARHDQLRDHVDHTGGGRPVRPSQAHHRPAHGLQRGPVPHDGLHHARGGQRQRSQLPAHRALGAAGQLARVERLPVRHARHRGSRLFELPGRFHEPLDQLRHNRVRVPDHHRALHRHPGLEPRGEHVPRRADRRGRQRASLRLDRGHSRLPVRHVVLPRDRGHRAGCGRMPVRLEVDPAREHGGDRDAHHRGDPDLVRGGGPLALAVPRHRHHAALRRGPGGRQRRAGSAAAVGHPVRHARLGQRVHQRRLEGVVLDGARPLPAGVVRRGAPPLQDPLQGDSLPDTRRHRLRHPAGAAQQPDAALHGHHVLDPLRLAGVQLYGPELFQVQEAVAARVRAPGLRAALPPPAGPGAGDPRGAGLLRDLPGVRHGVALHPGVLFPGLDLVRRAPVQVRQARRAVHGTPAPAQRLL